MNIKQLGKNWNAWGEKDPMYAVLTDPSKRHNGWDAEEFFATGRAEIKKVMDYVAALGHPLAKDAALDFGCGVGRLSQALAEHFQNVVGVDIAPSMIERANTLNRFPQRCRFVVNAIDDLSQFDANQFDFIYTNIVLQHMLPIYSHKYIRDFFRIVRPGGLVVFQIPEPPAVSPVVSVSWRTRGRRMVKSLINLGGSLVGKTLVPEIAMYGTPRRDVEALITSAGGTLLDAVRDEEGGNDWTGYRYCATKRS